MNELFPIIRRKRRPLLPQESVTPMAMHAPVPETARAQSVAPEPSGDVLPQSEVVPVETVVSEPEPSDAKVTHKRKAR